MGNSNTLVSGFSLRYASISNPPSFISALGALEKRVPAKQPLRLVRSVVNEVLAALDSDFSKAYADGGRPSIPPEHLLRALLLQAFYTIRSERQLMEQLDYNLLYRWFVGLGVSRCGCRRCSRRTAIGCLRRTL